MSYHLIDKGWSVRGLLDLIAGRGAGAIQGMRVGLVVEAGQADSREDPVPDPHRHLRHQPADRRRDSDGEAK